MAPGFIFKIFNYKISNEFMLIDLNLSSQITRFTSLIFILVSVENEKVPEEVPFILLRYLYQPILLLLDKVNPLIL